MATTQNTFTGNGSTVLFSFTFPYLDESHIKVSLNGSNTTAYTLANATTIQMNTAPANGVAIRVYRETELVDLNSTFFSGSAIRAQDLNDNFLQSLYLTQETRDITVDASTGNIADGSIGSSKLAAGSVTADKLAAESVTTTAIAPGAVTESDLASSAVTDIKVAPSAGIQATKLSFTNTGTGANARTVASKLSDLVSVKDFGAVGDGIADDTSAIQEAINAANVVFIPPGTYRCDTAITLKSYTHVYGARGASILRQYGDNLFLGSTSMAECTVEQLSLDYRTTVSSPYHCAFKLKSHAYCTFQDLTFTRYDDCTIFERFVQSDDTVNTVFNKYANLYVSACNTLDVAAGFEEYQYVHVGNGSTTIINTAKTWPEQFNSSVVVLKESNRRIFSELTLSTDYTVSYPSGLLQVVLTTPAASNERIWIYPACPRNLNRRPISNNSWEHVRASYIFSRGHTAVRWLDAETYTDEHLPLASDFAVCYDTNPYLTRGGQGGDYNTYNGCVLTYLTFMPGLTNSTTCRAFRFGPGSFNMVGDAVKMDLTWENGSGINHGVEVINKGILQLAGTVSTTAGSAVVTGVGTAFRNQLSLVGSVVDVVRIDNVFYGIASIDSNLQITLATNALSTLSGVACFRQNFSDIAGYDINFSSIGAGLNNRRLIQTEGGQSRSRSRTLDYGTFTILSGQTSATVSHRVWRAPAFYEIRLTPASLLNGRSISVSNTTTTTFQANISSAAAADYNIGYIIELLPLNLSEAP
jgi:hypothetical protein